MMKKPKARSAFNEYKPFLINELFFEACQCDPEKRIKIEEFE